jgi:glycosyltransferase involved in cell wall biosynthesis
MPTSDRNVQAAQAATTRATIAIVVQRYGIEINGGAEAHARMLAHRLLPHYDVEVLTTCAANNRHWGTTFPPGSTRDGDVVVKRFPHTSRGNFFARRTPLIVRWRCWRASKRGGSQPIGSYVPEGSTETLNAERSWLVAQGPASSALNAYLTENLSRYDAVLVFSLRYATAVDAITIASLKAILIPTLHDEKAMYRSIFRRAIANAGHILFNTDAEKQLAAALYGGDTVAQSSVVGVGVDVSAVTANEIARVRKSYGIDSRYFIYAGRINRAKGCQLLFDGFQQFSSAQREAVKLLCVGHADMPLPSSDWLVAPGFVSNADRDALIAGAVALAMPSQFESLSLATLEAMRLGIPVIVNRNSAVLNAHVRNSGTGFTFSDAAGCAAALTKAMALDEAARASMGDRSRNYVEQNYSWGAVIRGVTDAITRIANHADTAL